MKKIVGKPSTLLPEESEKNTAYYCSGHAIEHFNGSNGCGKYCSIWYYLEGVIQLRRLKCARFQQLWFHLCNIPSIFHFLFSIRGIGAGISHQFSNIKPRQPFVNRCRVESIEHVRCIQPRMGEDDTSAGMLPTKSCYVVNFVLDCYPWRRSIHAVVLFERLLGDKSFLFRPLGEFFLWFRYNCSLSMSNVWCHGASF